LAGSKRHRVALVAVASVCQWLTRQLLYLGPFSSLHTLHSGEMRRNEHEPESPTLGHTFDVPTEEARCDDAQRHPQFLVLGEVKANRGNQSKNTANNKPKPAEHWRPFTAAFTLAFAFIAHPLPGILLTVLFSSLQLAVN
jgi:hypothetical protein